jgi:hypothetical protein
MQSEDINPSHAFQGRTYHLEFTKKRIPFLPAKWEDTGNIANFNPFLKLPSERTAMHDTIPGILLNNQHYAQALGQVIFSAFPATTFISREK